PERAVVPHAVEEGAQRLRRAEPARGLLEREPCERAQRAAEERGAGRDRRIVGDALPELEHLARRLAGRDERGVDAAGRGPGEHRGPRCETRVLEQALVDADLERASRAAPREHEHDGARTPPSPDHHNTPYSTS